MTSIRPINEELNRLHQQPVVSEEMDDQLALAGFSVTSCISRPETATSGRWRRSSETSMLSASCPRHGRQISSGSMRNNLIYYPHQLQPILTAVNPYCAAAAASAYPQPHYYRQTSYGSPGAIPRVSW